MSPTIQLEPGQSISFEKLKAILDCIDELREVANRYFEGYQAPECVEAFIFPAIKDLLEVYEDD